MDYTQVAPRCCLLSRGWFPCHMVSTLQGEGMGLRPFPPVSQGPGGHDHFAKSQRANQLVHQRTNGQLCHSHCYLSVLLETSLASTQLLQFDTIKAEGHEYICGKPPCAFCSYISLKSPAMCSPVNNAELAIEEPQGPPDSTVCGGPDSRLRHWYFD